MENKYSGRGITFETLEKAVSGDYNAIQEVIMLFKTDINYTDMSYTNPIYPSGEGKQTDDMLFEEMFQISKEPRDAFDVHAGAFETAAMREIYPEAVRENALIPNGYVGDPKGSQYIETNLKEADRRIARDIVNSFVK